MNNDLVTLKRSVACASMKRRLNGWTPERRARQALAIRRWQPWRRSTGPKTEAGKARVTRNALRHGYRSRAWILKAKRIRRPIRLSARTVLFARVYLLDQERRALLPLVEGPNARPLARRRHAIALS
jgi:hypothetical protein